MGSEFKLFIGLLFKFLHTMVLFFFVLASLGDNFTEECLVSLYCTTIESKTSIYLLVELAVKYLNIFSLIVPFHRSIIQDFSSFSVEYSTTSFWTSLL